MVDIATVRIDELEELQLIIKKRIDDITEENGLVPDFEGKLDKAFNELRELINDRVDHDDDGMLLLIARNLSKLLSDVMSSLTGNQSENPES